MENKNLKIDDKELEALVNKQIAILKKKVIKHLNFIKSGSSGLTPYQLILFGNKLIEDNIKIIQDWLDNDNSKIKDEKIKDKVKELSIYSVSLQIYIINELKKENKELELLVNQQIEILKKQVIEELKFTKLGLGGMTSYQLVLLNHALIKYKMKIIKNCLTDDGLKIKDEKIEDALKYLSIHSVSLQIYILHELKAK